MKAHALLTKPEQLMDVLRRELLDVAKSVALDTIAVMLILAILLLVEQLVFMILLLAVVVVNK